MTGTSLSALWLVAALAVPGVMLLACLSRRLRERVPSLLWLAPMPALGAAVLASGSHMLMPAWTPHGVALELDAPGAMLLGVAALLWVAAGVYAFAYLDGKPHAGRFTVCWLLTLLGNIGVFITADLASFYLAFALVSIPAYGLVVYDRTLQVRRAGAVYMALTLFGENCLLIAFVMLAATVPQGNLSIRDCVAALPASQWRDVTLALLIAGFGLKAGLVPLHVWMPLAYTAAPLPAAAVLSGAVVKAGVIGLIRFLPIDHGAAGWGGVLAAVGLLSAFYGVAVGITQANPKTVLAYSSISQMGLISAVLGTGLISGGHNAAVTAAFYAAHHILAKGALFLAIGVVALSDPARLWAVWLPAVVLALGLGGFPLTGGALAKIAVKEPLGTGLVAILSTFAAAGSTLLMLHFLNRLRITAVRDAKEAVPAGLVLPWLAMALAAMVVPWTLYFVDGLGTFSGVMSLEALWAGLWPALIGGLLALGLWRWTVPELPEGDIVVFGEGAVRASLAWGEALERGDGVLRRWPVACLSLLVIAIILGVLMLAAR